MRKPRITTVVLVLLIVVMWWINNRQNRADATAVIVVATPPVQEDSKPIERTRVAIREWKEDRDDAPGNEGQFIAVSADYRQHLGFPGYVALMQKLGGKFVLFDSTRQRIVAETDPVNGYFFKITENSLVGFSPRSREVHKEIAVSKTLNNAQAKYGPGRYKILLLLPQAVDDRMQSQLATLLKNRDVDFEVIVRAAGTYQKDELVITSVQDRQGGNYRVDFSLQL